MKKNDADNAVRLLVVAAAVETSLALVRRAADAEQLLHGHVSFDNVSGLIGLIWLPVMVAVLWYTVLRLGWFERRSDQDAAAIAAAAATSHEWQWEADADLVLTWSNDRVRDVLGRSATEVVGQPLDALLTDADRARFTAMTDQATSTGSGWRDVEHDWQGNDLAPVRLESSASVLLDRYGQVTGFRGAHRVVPASAAADAARNVARAKVQRVLDTGAITLAVQPIMRLDGGEVAGFEALARFPGEDTEAMFDDADAVGLGLELELLAFRCALPLLEQLPEETFLSINASPDLLLDERLAPLLQERPHHLDRLVVEVTERLRVRSYDDLHAILAPLRAQGMRLAVDDTGAGYASFHHVLQLQPDSIKLDRSLVSAIDRDAAQRSLVTAVALLALDLGATLTAEGIETADQLSTLTDLGIDHGQGYHLGRPTIDLETWLPAARLAHLLPEAP